LTSPTVLREERTGRVPSSGCTSRRRTAVNGPSAYPHWRIRSSSGRLSRCSMRSMKRISWRKETRDVRLPRLHPHQWQDEEWTFLGQAQNNPEANGCKAARDQGRAAAPKTPAGQRGRAVAADRAARALPVLRGADKLPLAQCNAASRGLVMATRTPTQEPAHPLHLGTVLPDRRAIPPASPNPTSLAKRATVRQYLREEPSAVVPLAGICAGGSRQRESLPITPSGLVPGTELRSGHRASGSG